ncbi:hypothetical protein [Rickettsiella endosymbiont of Xylota segnis]|uniref:hypothetical protein n=1 Tax=Rickettsiella endosymbiont of Xylota segnis TaxID=3066238 RepID=UPI0030CEEAC3
MGNPSVLRQSKLGEKPEHTWREAVVRWLKESAHKRSLKNDKCQLKWVNSYLSNKKLSEIDNFMIEEIAKKKASEWGYTCHDKSIISLA